MSLLYNHFHQFVSATPLKTALVIEEHSYSYEQLDQLTLSLSDSLNKAGICTGEHIGLVLGNSIEFVLMLLAASKLGLVLVPLNPSLSPEMLARSLAAADVNHLIASEGVLDSLNGIWPTLNKDLKPTLLIAVNTNKAKDLSNKRYLDFSKLSNNKFVEQDCSPIVNVGSPYILSLTSGSTGDPKPIVFSQTTKYQRAISALKLYDLSSKDITLAATPLYHSLAMRLVLLPLISGGCAVVMPRFTADSWLKTVQDKSVTFSIAVSSQLKQILSVLRSSQMQLKSLRCLVSSSALLELSLKEELLGFLECDFHECYGTSEIAIATNLSNYQAKSKFKSVGSPIPGASLVILDDDRNPVPIGDSGEICCKTPLLFSGYYKRELDTKAAMYDGYFCTGDVGTLDQDGFLTFLGRKKEIIISAGINVYPKDIEDVINSHPAVLECAVVAVADPQFGEVIGVAIVAKDDLSDDSKSIEQKLRRDLSRMCAKKLADYQQPRYLQFVTMLPKNSMGKILKRELSPLFSAHFQSSKGSK